MLHRHLERSLQFYGEKKGLILFRKHAMQYLKLQSLPQHPGLALDCERLLTAPSPVVEAGGGPSRNQASQPAVTPG